jgi:thiamine biosynthesis lipoprotein
MTNPAGDKEILAHPFLKNTALSGSGVQKGGHIIDPRTAEPVEGRRAAWSSAPDAATADALSTAFMIMGTDEIKQYCSRHPDMLAMVILEEDEQKLPRHKILRFGAWESIL